MRWVMIAHLKRPPYGFEEAVRRHFRLLRSRIMRTAARWLAAAVQLSGIDQVQAPFPPSYTHKKTSSPWLIFVFMSSSLPPVVSHLCLREPCNAPCDEHVTWLLKVR